MQLPHLCWLVPLLLRRASADLEQDETPCSDRSFQPYMVIPGQAIITAFIDGHTGDNCTIPVAIGLSQMAAAVWAVTEANAANLIPGIKIGLEIFDTCGSDVVTQKTALASLSDSDCDGHYPLGVLTSSKTATQIRPLIASLDIESFSKFLPEQKNVAPTAKAAAEVLKALKITQTAVVAHSAAAIRTFVSAANKMDICVTWQDVLTDISDEDEGNQTGEAPSGGSAVIIGPWATIREHLESLQGGVNFTSLSWILAPTDLPWEVVSEESLEGLPVGTLVVAASAEHALHLDSVVNQETLEVLGVGVLSSEAPVSELRRASAVVLEAVSHLREALLEDCGAFVMCTTLSPLAHHNFSEEALLAPSALDLPSTAKGNLLEPLVKVGRLGVVSNLVESLADLHPDGRFKMDNTTTPLPHDWLKGGCGKNCVCLNEVYRPSVWSLISWRGEIWVAVVTSVAGVGVALSLAVAIFIIVRIVKGDVLEGNPTFSFILLFGVVFTYVAVLPYCASGPRLLCVLRELGTSLGYALLFSVMLARAIMLTTTDEQGFMSHVSGYLQAALWFFIIAVQIALTTQFMLVNSAQLMAMPVSDLDNVMTCHQSRTAFLVLLGYDLMLLFMLLLISPLVARSKRNYREGLFFCLASWLCLVCWSLWVSAFILLEEEWRAMTIAFGQVACASVILGAIFIPRTYMIVSSVTRARIASAIPCAAAAYSSSTNILDIQYRSNQALYDSVHNVHNMHGHGGGAPAAPPLPKSSPRHGGGAGGGGGGVANPNYYSEQPRGTHSAASTMKAGRNYATPMGRTPSPENTYTRYDTPPSPLKVTRF